MNPVRSFSADVVLTTFDGYHWIYWVGPCLGSILAAGFYGFSKFLEFETVHAENEPSELTTISDTGADYLESGKIPRTDGGEGGGIVMVTTPDLASQNGHDAITKVSTVKMQRLWTRVANGKDQQCLFANWPGTQDNKWC